MRLALAMVLSLWLGSGCDGCDANGGNGGGGSGGSGGSGGVAGQGGSTGGAGGGTGGIVFGGSGGAMGPFPDFPPDPVIEGGAPADAETLFGPEGSGAPNGGPCLVEPSPGALFPMNWLRPRFRWIAPAPQNLFEIRVKAPDQVDDLVVYTTDTSWTMPKLMWEGLAIHSNDVPIEVTVRGAEWDGTTIVGMPSIGSTNTVRVAPVEAPGSIVYWTTTGGSSLKGFQVGDESVITVLQPPDVQMNTVGGADVTCVGCHTSTPDGEFASFTAQGPWGNALGSVEAATKGAAPPWLGAGALQVFQSISPLGIHTYSLAHWAPGDRVAILPYGDNAAAQLIWVDMEAQSAAQGQGWGVVARNGDTAGAGAPAWSHDGSTIVYVSTNAQFTGRLDAGFADLFSVPYAGKQGGQATPIPGASDPSFVEYYPVFTPDDALLAFNRAPNGVNMYDQPQAEVFVIPSGGGAPTRLAANDPPACLGETSPGVTNSWPKWSPSAQTVGGSTYYWLIFSSRREVGSPQLYVTGVILGADGSVQTHGALYLWNQPGDESNHTPAWDVFEIPVIPPA